MPNINIKRAYYETPTVDKPILVKLDRFINRYGLGMSLFMAIAAFVIINNQIGEQETKLKNVDTRKDKETKNIIDQLKQGRSIAGKLAIASILAIILKRIYILRLLDTIKNPHDKSNLLKELTYLQHQELKLRKNLSNTSEILEIENKFRELTPVFITYIEDRGIEPSSLFTR